MDILLWIAIIVLILLPPSLDPAIRWKMRQIMNGTHPESKDAEWIVWCRYPGHQGRLYLCLGEHGLHWTKQRSKAVRFNTAETAAQQLSLFPEDMKWRTGIEIA